MTRVRFFAVPDVAAQAPAEQSWHCIDNATTASTGDLTQLVLAQPGLPPKTTLWLRTKGGWKRVSSLAEVPSGNLVVKAVVGQPGGLTLCMGDSKAGCQDLGPFWPFCTRSVF